MRELLVASLRIRTEPWLRASSADWDACVKSDHLLDALVCALVARASAVGETDEVPPESMAAAAREGWIALPRSDSLSRLRRTDP